MSDVELDELAGLKELAGILNVPYRTLEQWAYRYKATGFPPMLKIGPTEEGRLSMGRIWRVRDVVQWWIDWDSPMKKMKNEAKPGHVDPELLTKLGIDQGSQGNGS